MGARAMGMGYASSCLKDEWSLFNNAAGLAEVKSPVSAFSFHHHPSFHPFNRAAVALTIPSKIGTAGIGIFRYGDKIYNEQLASAAFANKLGLAALGLKISYIQYQADGFGSKGFLTVSFGGQAELTKKLIIGAHVTNINSPTITKTDKAETITTLVNLGVALKPSEKVLLTGEVEKNLRHDACYRAAFEYRFIPRFTMRSGFALYPDAAFFGFGFKPKRFSLDYALQYNVLNGVSHQLSTSIKLLRR